MAWIHVHTRVCLVLAGVNPDLQPFRHHGGKRKGGLVAAAGAAALVE